MKNASYDRLPAKQCCNQALDAKTRVEADKWRKQGRESGDEGGGRR
jgi:hypothetical protein